MAVAVAGYATKIAREDFVSNMPNARRQVIGVFDIPIDTPPGRYDVDLLKREMQESPVVQPATGEPLYELPQPVVIVTGSPAKRTIVVLPHALRDTGSGWVSEDCGGLSQVPCDLLDPNLFTGSSTPASFWKALGKTGYGWGATPNDEVFTHVFPDPQIIFQLPSTGGEWPAAFEADITYRSDKIEVRDVVEPAIRSAVSNDRAMVFHEIVAHPTDPDLSITKVKAVVHPDQIDIKHISVIFAVLYEANNTFERLQPDIDVQNEVTLAADVNGMPLPTPDMTLIGATPDMTLIGVF
ncbi:MAG: hypothetical protein IH867_10115 [Chloroflexi bacterium]|nr:hypothetical protein [Chloroflexota bacterium]